MYFLLRILIESLCDQNPAERFDTWPTGMTERLLMSRACRSTANASSLSFARFWVALGRDMSWLPGPTSLHHNGLLSHSLEHHES